MFNGTFSMVTQTTLYCTRPAHLFPWTRCWPPTRGDIQSCSSRACSSGSPLSRQEGAPSNTSSFFSLEKFTSYFSTFERRNKWAKGNGPIDLRRNLDATIVTPCVGSKLLYFVTKWGYWQKIKKMTENYGPLTWGLRHRKETYSHLRSGSLQWREESGWSTWLTFCFQIENYYVREPEPSSGSTRSFETESKSCSFESNAILESLSLEGSTQGDMGLCNILWL